MENNLKVNMQVVATFKQSGIALKGTLLTLGNDFIVLRDREGNDWKVEFKYYDITTK